MLPTTPIGQSGARSAPRSNGLSGKPSFRKAWRAQCLAVTNSRLRLSTARETHAFSSGGSTRVGSSWRDEEDATAVGNILSIIQLAGSYIGAGNFAARISQFHDLEFVRGNPTFADPRDVWAHPRFTTKSHFNSALAGWTLKREPK
jgi:hypothetical protein